MPAALYPRAKTIIFATQSATGLGPSEVKAHLLCSECEERFNEYGESDVLRLLAPKATRKRLPLLARLENATPLRVLPGELTVYSGPSVGIDPCSFAYFALSLAWRAAVHRWTLPDGSESTLIDLGHHEEPTRHYLLQEGPFPSDTAVVMSVCRDEASREIWIAPGDGIRHDYGCSVIRMQLLGLILVVWLGATIPDHIRQLCCCSSLERPFIVAACSDVTAHMLGQLAPMPPVPQGKKRRGGPS